MTALARLMLVWLLALASAAPAARLVLADAQVVAAGDAGWVLRLRSSGPQAFDVVPQPNPRRLVVRLHGAVLGDLASLGTVPFGTVRIERDRRDVVVRVTLDDSGLRGRAVQGRSADVVEIRIER
jgi:hypothetical protein